jgi:N-acetylglucosamine-6-phosphate deacetylase
MVIKNAKVYTENFEFQEKDICVEQGVFTENASEQNIVYADDLYAIPGLIDIHLHGAVGQDFSDGSAKAVEKIAEYEAFHGITTIMPTTMSIPSKELEKAVKAIASVKNNKETQADVAGIYLEGPFMSKERKGVHKEENLRKPDLALVDKLQKEAKGKIKIVTVAPELEGAIDFIQEGSKKYRISIAHTSAAYEVSKEAFAAGAKQLTHFFNGMAPFNHREPGIIGAALENDKCMAELICDEFHIHPTVINMTFRVFGAERVILVSDSMRATGMTDGEYMLGEHQVIVTDGVARMKDGNLAGSTRNLMDCLKIAVKDMKIPLETAIRAATLNPAIAAGVDEKYGSISTGKKANAVFVDKELNVVMVMKDGKIIRNDWE